VLPRRARRCRQPSRRNSTGSCSRPPDSAGPVGHQDSCKASSSPQISRALFGCHPDLVEDGNAVFGNAASATPTDVLSGVIPFARLTVLAEYPLDIFVGALRPTGCRPASQGLGVGDRPMHQSGRPGRLRRWQRPRQWWGRQGRFRGCRLGRHRFKPEAAATVGGSNWPLKATLRWIIALRVHLCASEALRAWRIFALFDR
jgi:hypothetical protein